MRKKEISELYIETQPLLYRYFYFHTFSREQAEDLTSAVYLRILEKMDLYNPDKAGLKVWLWKIAKNLWIDELRKLKRWTWVSGDSCNNLENICAEKELKQVEDILFLQQLLCELSEREKNIVVMRYLKEYEYREISSISGLSEKNISVILSRSLKKIRDKN